LAKAVGTESLWVPAAINWIVTILAWLAAGLLAPLAIDNSPRGEISPWDIERELSD
jgi:hypothetical protein